ncbi:MFS transporter [Actinomycetospora sp. NBRC 106375]|uniref:MFS transporter n=1 Tax=Actinomycetospora sp. NBRC 106375 TaxID=3032207 RepID=UPI0024A48325|nr:MFS transporter [Actinomycetospora sp. NBRC 106375]GLZ46929.1 MFS transporter [Actinomycetospora sp. NBRC 106375]
MNAPAVLQRMSPTAAAAPDRFDRRLIAPMILGAILNPINSSMIAVALIPIGIALGAPPAETAWLVSGLYLATAIGQPVVGRLVDLCGARRLFLVGATLIGVGGLLGALAPSIGVLVLSRVLLGLGTCSGYPAAMTLIRGEADRTGHDSPAGILTVLAVSTQTVAVIGPTLGGFLIGVGGWRATFTVNVPLALACLVLGALYLPRTPITGATGVRAVARAVDPVGIALFVATLVTLLLFLTHLSPGLWWLMAVTVAAGVALAWWELRTPRPFLDLRVLGGNLPLLATFARALLAAITSYALLYGYTQWLEEGRGLSPQVAGLVLLPIFGGGIVVSLLTGRRTEIRGKLVAGAFSQVLVAVLLLFVDAGSAIWFLLVLAVVAGVPQGLNNLANQNAVYFQADPERLGSSAGLMRTFFYLGAITASATNGIVFRDGATTPGVHELAIVMLVASGLFLVLTLADRSLARVRAPGS